jgi:hypothetical protein
MPRRGDGDDWIDEMADEVADALADLGLFDEATRATLVETMREAVAEIPSRDDDSDDDEGDEDDDHPNVTVLPGGRGEDDAPTPGAPPTLRVVEGSGGDDDDDDNVAVRVLRLGRRPLSRAASEGVSADGHIQLPAQLPAQLGHGAEIWQTILHAAAPRAYRIRCDSGELQVMADGDLVVRLVPGQTSDVEGEVIRVRGDGVASATGRYTRLS